MLAWSSGALGQLSDRLFFDVPAASADKSLVDFARQARVSVLFPTGGVSQVRTNPVHGEYAVEDALRLLLNDSGLTGELQAAGTLTVKFINKPGTSAMASTQRKGWLATLLASLSALGATPGAYAQVAEDTATLDEIVVTAERREANVQDIAIALTAITGDALDDKAVRRVEDLQFAAPGLTVTNAGITQAVNIRGVGLASRSPSVTNGVSTYIDGLFQPPIVTTNSFFDIADVQVLRGPQGTFVGSSSTGGAIFINSRNPDVDAVSGHVNGELGNYSRKNLQGALNLPLASTFAVRGAFNYTDRSSYYTDHGALRNDAGSLEELSGRVGLIWKPSESFQALLKMEYSDKNTGGFPMRPIPTTAYAAGRIGGIRDLNYDTPTRNDERQDIKSLELRYITSSGITLRSLTGHQDKEVHNLTDIDSSTLNTSPAVPSRRQVQDVRERVATEEINIISPTEGRWDWIVGGYYQNNKIDVINLNFVGAAVFPQRVFIPTEKTVIGYFGQLAFQATEALEISLGLRKSEFEGSQRPGAGVYINFGRRARRLARAWRTSKARTRTASRPASCRSTGNSIPTTWSTRSSPVATSRADSIPQRRSSIRRP
jgi:iron complex outermembrane receptor protein